MDERPDLDAFAATGDVPADAQKIANVAFREARDNGCNCDPNIAMRPIVPPPFWSALVEHDAGCRLAVDAGLPGARP